MNQTGLRSLRDGRSSASVITLGSCIVGLLALGCDPGVTPVDSSFVPDGAVPDGGGMDGGGTDGGGTDGGGTDGGVIDDDCTGATDGAACVLEDMDDRRAICLGESCVVSSCGDGFADTTGDHPSGVAASETCDDGNAVSGDGCEDDCTFSCAAAADCADDEDVCNGTPVCNEDHFCEAEPATDGTECELDDTGAMGTCRGGACRSGTCGNGTIERGEDCDDENTVEGDGCDNDCTYTCSTDGDCQNDTVCDGLESCDIAEHTCVAGEALDCDDEDACTTDSCVPTRGCLSESVLVDEDGDEHFAIDEACGGDDCDDTDAAINPSAIEPCGGTEDVNCDGEVSATPTWYSDCDRDSFAREDAESVMQCEEPTTAATECRSRVGWTPRAPEDADSSDCDDVRNAVNPDQEGWFDEPTSTVTDTYDYDCSGREEREFPTRPRIIAPCMRDRLLGCTGTTYWDEATVPACGSDATRSSCTVGLRGCIRTESEAPVRCH